MRIVFPNWEMFVYQGHLNHEELLPKSKKKVENEVSGFLAKIQAAIVFLQLCKVYKAKYTLADCNIYQKKGVV